MYQISNKFILLKYLQKSFLIEQKNILKILCFPFGGLNLSCKVWWRLFSSFSLLLYEVVVFMKNGASYDFYLKPGIFVFLYFKNTDTVLLLILIFSFFFPLYSFSFNLNFLFFFFHNLLTHVEWDHT